MIRIKKYLATICLFLFAGNTNAFSGDWNMSSDETPGSGIGLYDSGRGSVLRGFGEEGNEDPLTTGAEGENSGGYNDAPAGDGFAVFIVLLALYAVSKAFQKKPEAERLQRERR